MANINRIRVNNVKYNFGTQFYDDFIMRMSGKNTIYDLANGGGKSVLMLLLMQNMIPNCTLDDKQPIEKLFRSGCGNTVIHSMVEWNLSENCIHNHFRYMLTGFCARKAKDEQDNAEMAEEEGQSASIEYFNYVIFYREMNDHDIKNFPLSSDGERITYSGLKNYLRQLEKKDFNLQIKIFDRKGDYQRFVAGYGIYESEWEIIRGINKTEGHVRTYFETNYKTTRKVVEDLLIEEIIQKSFQSHQEADGQQATMAQTLLDIKDKLLELSKRKTEIHNYDRQIELLEIFSNRAQNMKQLYVGQKNLEEDLLKTYHTRKKKDTKNQEKKEQLKQYLQEYQKKHNEIEARIEAAKVEQNKIQLDVWEKELEEKEQQHVAWAEECADLEAERKHKESANDYLDYVYYKQKRDEVVESLSHMQQGKEELLEQLHYLAALKKQKDAKTVADWQESLSGWEEQYETAQKSLDEVQKQERELDRQIAVAIENGKRLEGEIEYVDEQFGQLKKDKAILLPSNLVREENRCGVEIEQTKAELAQIKTDYKELQKKQVQLEIALGENANARAELTQKMDSYTYEDNRQFDDKKRMDNLKQVYGEHNLRVLAAKMKSYYEERIVRMEDIRQSMREKQEQLKRIQSGQPIAEREEIRTVMEYVQRYHQVQVQTGLSYVMSLETREREDILEWFPMLPYCILVSGNPDELLTDANLSRLELQDGMVMLVDKTAVEQRVPVVDYNAVVLAAKEKEMFYTGNWQNVQLQKLAEIVGEEKKEYDQLAEAVEILMQDMQFVYYYTNHEKSGENAEPVSYEAMIKQQRELENRREELLVTKEQCIQEMVAFDEKEEGLRQHLEQLKAELDEYIQLKQLYEKSEQLRNSLRQQTEQMGQWQREYKNVAARMEAGTNRVAKWEEQIAARKQMIRDMEEEWKNIYQPYYKEMQSVDSDADTGIEGLKEIQDESQASTIHVAATKTETGIQLDIGQDRIESRFKGILDAWKSESHQTEDKQKLIENYEMAMDKTMLAIDYKGYDISSLKEQYSRGELMKTDNAQLLSLKEQWDKLNETLKKWEKERRKLQSRQDKLEGNIERSIEEITQRYGVYPQIFAGADIQKAEDGAIDEFTDQSTEQRTDYGVDQSELQQEDGTEFAITPQNLELYVKQQQQLLVEMEEKNKQIYTESKQLEEEEKQLLVMEHDLNRMIQEASIDVTGYYQVWDDNVNLEETFDKIRKTYDTFRREMSSRREEFEKDKQQLLETLTAMDAIMLADEVRKNIRMPLDMEQTETLLANIKDVNSCIQLEKEQVARGIEDMERMKTNFRSQCLQTCMNIKIELDRLPKLSRIVLDGENISMIRLQIPYIQEEHYTARMESYIDEIIQNAEEIKSAHEKLKYIRNQLAWKRLFAVIVTDMNRIKLNLYKRERIKEQSRYLRYEEAVGSTGQSQGIYIQFLIAIVNYISSIHARNVDATKLKKIIFIDNPFGAAKDVYIWEPIFQLLKTNNVQLVVPARGTTPAITGRFDVNYILGQKLINGKQQTVVVDYISHVEQSQLEYTTLTFEQTSLF